MPEGRRRGGRGGEGHMSARGPARRRLRGGAAARRAVRSSGCRRTRTGARCATARPASTTTRSRTPGSARRASTCGRTSSTTSGAWCATAPRRTSATAARARTACTDSDRGPRDRAAARPVAALRGRALPPRALADARGARAARAGRGGRRATTSPPRRALLGGGPASRRSLAGRWLLRDFRRHPAGFPEPAPSHGLEWTQRYDGEARAAGPRRTGQEVPGDRRSSSSRSSLVAAALLSVRVLREYERAVVFRLGRLLPVKGPGPGDAGARWSTGWCAWTCAP